MCRRRPSRPSGQTDRRCTTNSPSTSIRRRCRGVRTSRMMQKTQARSLDCRSRRIIIPTSPATPLPPTPERAQRILTIRTKRTDTLTGARRGKHMRDRKSSQDRQLQTTIAHQVAKMSPISARAPEARHQEGHQSVSGCMLPLKRVCWTYLGYSAHGSSRPAAIRPNPVHNAS